MVLGSLPIALSLGAAATSRIPLGIVLVLERQMYLLLKKKPVLKAITISLLTLINLFWLMNGKY